MKPRKPTGSIRKKPTVQDIQDEQLCAHHDVRGMASKIVEIRNRKPHPASIGTDTAVEFNNEIDREIRSRVPFAMNQAEKDGHEPGSPAFDRAVRESVEMQLECMLDDLLWNESLRDRLSEHERDMQMIETFATKRQAKDDRKIRTSTKGERFALLSRLEDKSNRRELTEEYFTDNQITNPEPHQRAAAAEYLNEVERWLKKHARKSDKDFEKLRTSTNRELRDIRGQLAPDSYGRGNDALGRYYHWPLADSVAKKETLALYPKDAAKLETILDRMIKSKPEHTNDDTIHATGRIKEPRDHFHRLRGVLMMLGQGCAETINKPWVDALATLRGVCGRRGKADFTEIVWCMIPSLQMRFHHPFTFEDCQTFLIDDKFKPQVGEFLWKLSDMIKEEEDDRQRAQTKYQAWKTKAQAARDAGRVTPPRPLPEQEREDWRRAIIFDRHTKRGWPWDQVAEELVKLEIERLNVSSGQNQSELMLKADRTDAVKKLSDRLRKRYAGEFGT